MRFIVLSRSSKFHNLCVAGIDAKTNKLARLVSKYEDIHGAIIEEDFYYSDGSEIDYFDEIEIETIKQNSNDLQTENFEVVDFSYIKKICHHDKFFSVIKKIDEPSREYIFEGIEFAIPCGLIKNINYSLQFVKVENLFFYHQKNSFNQNKLKCEFDYNGHHYENISVTDPDFYDAKENEKINSAYVLFSLGTPAGGYYYKFAAAIYQL